MILCLSPVLNAIQILFIFMHLILDLTFRRILHIRTLSFFFFIYLFLHSLTVLCLSVCVCVFLFRMVANLMFNYYEVCVLRYFFT